MNAQKMITQLKSLATDERKMANEQFFKTGPGQYSEHDRFIGVRVPQTRSLAKKYFKAMKFREIDQLIKHPVHEIRHFALMILVNKYQANNEEVAFNYYLNNLDSVNNWDLVDATAPHIAGHYIFYHRHKLPLLTNWAYSKNLWKRRIAIIATLVFIKQSLFMPTLKISKILLNDQEDLIHKAVGWMLREVYKKDNDTCKAFIQENYAQLPRTTLRYAIEHMQENERKRYLKGIFNVSN
jgi:3-methyladenine DNA glycosylase AlkD